MTQADIDLLLLKNIKVYVRLDLIDTDFEKIGELQGAALSHSPNISNSSEIRRTNTLVLHVPDKVYLASSFEDMWIDRLIRIYVGIYDWNATSWYLLGSLLLSDNSYRYDATTQELSLSLVDMMAATTETRGSQIGGPGLTIPAGSNVRSAIIATIAQFSPFIQYNVCEFDDTIPYDLEFGAEAYPIEVLKKIFELFPLYQMYYSPDGVFTVNRIPDGVNDPIILDETIMDQWVISENRSNSFRDVKNTTEIIGAELDAGYTSSTCTFSGDTYSLVFSTPLETLEANSTYSFTASSDSVSGQKIKIDSLTAYPVYVREIGGTESPIAVGAMLANVPYVVKYTSERFLLQGELDIHVIVQEVTAMPSTDYIANYKTVNDCRNVRYVVNPDSPFAVNFDTRKENRQVLRDADYADIYTTELAFERGMYENYRKARLTDKITLECKLIPFLDVNWKISYTSPTTGVVNTVIVQDISFDFATFTMNISANQFYPASPWDRPNDAGGLNDYINYKSNYGYITDAVSSSEDYGSLS